MQLLTLKDLQKNFEWKYDTYNALRQEAIKWIKADCDFHDWRLLFRKFFNITEEDLVPSAKTKESK